VIRVLVVEDMTLTRSAFVALFEHEADMEIVAAIGTGPGTAPVAAALQPDVVIIDSDHVIDHALPIVAELGATVRGCAVLILVDPRKPVVFPPGGYAWTPSFLVKDVSPDVLVETVRRLVAGERIIDERIAIAALTGGETALTNRELEVLRLAADGATVGEIAGRLYLSLGTVRNYISKVIGKTGARNRIDAIRIAREAGWLT
jgi:two-component system, NarL family, response regulator DesR